MKETNETVLKAALVEEIRKSLGGFVVFRHEDKLTHGIPDISVTGYGRTSWIEAKFADPNFKSKGIQELTMLRLAKSGRAFYVVWVRSKTGEISTHIVRASEIGKPIDSWTDFMPGIDHQFIIERIKEVHGVDQD